MRIACGALLMKRLFEDSAHAQLYASFRPVYSAETHDRILQYHRDGGSGFDQALDVGCGSGQSTRPLAAVFRNVTGTDVSQAQLDQASRDLPNVAFRASAAEDLSFLPDGSVDLVTVAQALHWIDRDAFYAHVRRVLKSRGTLAVYGYGCVQLDHPEAHDLVHNQFYRGLLHGGNYWDAARKHIDDQYAAFCPLPFSNFTRIDLSMEHTVSLPSFVGYLASMSGYRAFSDKHPHANNLEDIKTNLKDSRKSAGDLVKKPTEAEPPMGTITMPHPIWTEEQVHQVMITHKPPVGIIDRMAYASVYVMRKGFDFVSGYNRGERTERKWLNRITFLETVAGVPGIVAAMARHLHSLRRMRRDHGWIHTLLEEAENERMHLMTAMQLRKPGLMFRSGVVLTQGLFTNVFFITYLISPKFCHRFVGYLEEEAVITYTKLLVDIDNGPMRHWQTQAAPDVAIRYWNLKPEATMRDVVLAIRADEAHHRVVNHTLGSMNKDDYNPYKPGE